MMNHLPTYIAWLFGLTTLATAWLLYRASLRNKKLVLLIVAWLLLQGMVAATGFYTVTTSNPPRFLLLVVPPLLLVVVLFASNQGRRWLDRLHPGQLTLLHTIRIPVELVLYALYLHQTVPQLMTFEGRNWDILSGITAPFIYYFGYVKNKIPVRWLLLWNICCLLLLFNIVAYAVLSAPFPFQQLAFEQPNVAVLHFPFVWLPCFVVPVVLLSHLVCIRRLMQQKQ
jgi:hypothetical protein